MTDPPTAPDTPLSARARGLRTVRPRVSPVGVAAAIGALWGAVSFLLLWGYTSIQLTRQDVESVGWTIALLPIRIVLLAIHAVEDHVVHHPFQFVDNHDWIGAVAAAVGAVVAVAILFVGRLARSAVTQMARR